jgi:hypothetical protein
LIKVIEQISADRLGFGIGIQLLADLAHTLNQSHLVCQSQNGNHRQYQKTAAYSASDSHSL